MIVKAVFDDSDDFYVLNIPDCDLDEIQKLQDEFFKWMFNKNINHKYWVMSGDNKVGCAYGIDAFVEWVKMKYNINIKILDTYDFCVPEIYF